MNAKANERIQNLKAIEGYLASRSGHGDDLAGNLREILLKHFPQVAGDEVPCDRIPIEHWNSPRYGGDENAHEGQTFSAEVVDQRERCGQLMVTIADDNGHIDEQLSTAYEITSLPGSTAPVAALMLYDGDECIAKVAHAAAGHIILPMKPDVHIVQTALPDGQAAWLLTDCA